MTYTDYAEKLNEILDARRRISTSRSGLLPMRGKEKEHDRLTMEAEEVRKAMRRLRYGSE